MNSDPSPSDTSGKPPPFVVRILDGIVVAIIKLLIVLATWKSRDPREHSAHLLKLDREQQTRIRNWHAVLEWSPAKRVGCFIGVLVGVAVGGAILWYGVR